SRRESVLTDPRSSRRACACSLGSDAGALHDRDVGRGHYGNGPLIRDAVRNLVVNGLVAFGMIDSQLSGLRDQLVHALEHAEPDRAKAGDDSLDNAHRVVEPLVALIIGLEPHHDVLSSHALPFRVLAEDRPPLHEKGDLCPVSQKRPESRSAFSWWRVIRSRGLEPATLTLALPDWPDADIRHRLGHGHPPR